MSELPRGGGTGLRAGAAAVAEVVRLVLVESVRDGRLRTAGWPPGLRAIAALALVAYLAAAALLVAAPWARGRGTVVAAVGGELLVPRWATPVFMTLTVLTLALLYAGTLHLARWLRVATLLVVGLTLTGLVVSPPDQGAWPHVVAWSGWGLLVLLTALRWRARFRWWEFAVALVLIGTTVAVSLRLVARISQPLGFDTAPTALVLTMQTMTVLAVPFTFVAGVAFAQLSLLLVTRVGGVLDQRLRPTAALVVLVVVMAAADVTLTLRHLARPAGSGAGHPAELGAAALLVGLTAALAVLALRRRTAAPREDLEQAVTRVGLPVALLVTATAVAHPFLTRLHTQLVRDTGTDHLGLDDAAGFLLRSGVISGTRLVIGLVLVGWGLRSRHAVPALFAVATGTTLSVTALAGVTGGRVVLPWTSESLSDVTGGLVLAALGASALARRLSRPRLLRLGMLLGLALAFSVRSTFDAPFVTLLGLGAVGAAFLGVVWATLTDADDVNGDSVRWPRPARVLLFLGNALLAMGVLAFIQVARVGRIGLDTSPFATLGDDYLGTGLLLAACALLATEAWRPEPGGQPSD